MAIQKTIGEPVPDFPVKFEWQTGDWEDLFDRHVEFIQQDILRALVSDRMIVYLSCPISSRGGSFSSTNIEVADYTGRRLTDIWGTKFWFLNPSQYQLESKQGTGLIRRHAELLKLQTGRAIDIDALMHDSPPSGGDYMRMWTRVLVEDGTEKPLGSRFSAYYFIGPSDYREFFTKGRLSLSEGIEEYFTRKYITDQDFRKYFSAPFCDDKGNLLDEYQEEERRRKEFLRFYSVKAGAQFSKGSHDEWNIWCTLNKLRLADPTLGIGNQIPGFFEGRQIDLAASELSTSEGYMSDPKIENVIAPSNESSVSRIAMESLRRNPR